MAKLGPGSVVIDADKRPRRQPKASPLPVSDATGGLMPGVDISDSATLQEMDDLDAIERMKRLA